jgi:hypothetical protein
MAQTHSSPAIYLTSIHTFLMANTPQYPSINNANAIVSTLAIIWRLQDDYCLEFSS